MALTVVVFGQINQRPVYPLDQPVTMDRSEWVGQGTSQYYTIFDPDDIYITRLNSYGTLSAGSSIEKVKFYWRDTYNDDNNVEQSSDPNFQIIIYTGGNITWVNPVANVEDIDNAGRHTFDADAMGTQAYVQNYECTAAGWQEVTLTTPYQITGNEGEIWIGIKCGGTTTGLINCNATPGTQWGSGMLRYETQNNGTVLTIPLYYYDAAHTQITTAQYCLLAYVNDGAPYVSKCDWKTEIYDPDDDNTYPDEITYMQIQEWDEWINFYGGFYNMGSDSSYGLELIQLYAQVEGGQPVYFLNEDWTEGEVMGVEQYSGWHIGPANLVTVDSLEYYGLSFPFQLCLSVTYTSDASYNSIDPDLTNNTYCITVSDQPEPDGIMENTNTLSVTPNPASTTIMVANAAGAQISVYNIAGQEVMSVENAEANETLNVSNLNAGLYIVRVVNGNEVSTAKVSIVR